MKNLFYLIVLISLTSCTERIYRGEVTYVDPEKKLIELYGTNQSIWSEDQSLKEHDVVEITTKNKFQKFTVEVLCSPVHEHCHFDGYGLHVRGHIKEIRNGAPDDIRYEGNKYKAAYLEIPNESDSSISETLEIWVETNYDFTNEIVYVIILQDENFGYQLIQERNLILNYTTTHHQGH